MTRVVFVPYGNQAHAIKIALFDAAEWREMLTDALDRTGGPFTKKERAWADSIMPAQRHRKNRARTSPI